MAIIRAVEMWVVAKFQRMTERAFLVVKDSFSNLKSTRATNNSTKNPSQILVTINNAGLLNVEKQEGWLWRIEGFFWLPLQSGTWQGNGKKA